MFTSLLRSYSHHFFPSLHSPYSLFLSPNVTVPGPVASLTAVPSFFTVFYTWRGPLAPNGIITTYSIQYTSTNTQGSSTVSGSQRCFRTPDSYNMGSEVNLTVVAFTAVGPGAPTTITAHTLTRPCEYNSMIIMCVCVCVNLTCGSQ